MKVMEVMEAASSFTSITLFTIPIQVMIDRFLFTDPVKEARSR